MLYASFSLAHLLNDICGSAYNILQLACGPASLDLFVVPNRLKAAVPRFPLPLIGTSQVQSTSRLNFVTLSPDYLADQFWGSGTTYPSAGNRCNLQARQIAHIMRSLGAHGAMRDSGLRHNLSDEHQYDII